MKSKITKYIGLIPAVILSSLAVINPASAWGPERPTFTMESPATYPVFNSITNNPTIGDERDFVRIGEINSDVTNLRNTVEVVPGKQYLVYIYFHNNASSTYNDSAHNNSGVAVATRMSSSFSTIVTPSSQGTVTATITANNSNPLSVWDEAYMTTKSDKVYLRYVSGSSRIYNDWKTNDSVIPSNLFTEEGTLLGLNTLNGVIPGCEEYHGVVTYVLQAESLGGTIGKSVSKDGVNYGKSVSLNPGDEVYFELAIRNTGEMALTNVTVKDSLPDGLSLVSGSVKLRANESTTPDNLSDNIINNGHNLGTIGAGNVVYITYKATVSNTSGNLDCDGKELKNRVTLTYDNETSSGETKWDNASVIVKKADCEEDKTPPLDTCETNPSLEGCEANEEKETCATNPELEGCKELPNTGPAEIIMAVVIILCIGGGAYYFYRTKKTLSVVEKKVKGDEDNSSQKPDNMVK